jgi:cell division control protein 6
MSEDVWRIIEEEVRKPSIFKSKESLTPEYIPDSLPHREKELKELVSFFKHLVTSPGSLSQRVLLIGGVGTGKTATARVFGRDFTRFASTKGYKVRYAHVNCHSNRTLYNVIADMARQLNAPLPSRGLSAREMFEALLTYLDETDQYAIVSLDEFHYFASLAGRDAVYFVVRAYDVFETPVKRLNFIFISQDTAKLSLLDPALESYLLRHMIRLEPYTSSQLYDILKYRASKAFYEGTYDDSILRFIAEYEGYDKGGGGNARHAIEVLMIAGVMAESEGAKRLSLDHVRKAIMKVSRDILSISEAINYSSLHELLILLSTVRLLRRTGKPYVKIGDVEKEYEIVCESFNLQPRKHTQVYEYVMNLKKAGVIEARSSGKGMKGRTTLMGVSYGPLDLLEQYLLDLIKRKISMGAS